MQNQSTGRLFVRYALPQMLGLLFNSAYFIVDGVFIGNRLGREAMAAAAVSVPLIEIFLALSLAIASGAGILVSGLLANKRAEEASRVASLSVMFALGFSFILAVLGNVFLEPLVRFLGAGPEIHEEAATYLWYILTSAPFSFLSFLLGGLARNDGKPKLAMAAMGLGAVSNIVLDYVFMYPLNMGIAGAALATALGPVFAIVVLLPHFFMGKGSLKLRQTGVRLGTLKRVVTLGFPAFIMEFSIGIITLVYNLAIVRYGFSDLGLAAYLVIGYLMLLILTLFLGMAEGLQPVYSYLHGLKDKAAYRKMHAFALRVFVVSGLVITALVMLFARQFFLLFSPGDMELVDFVTQKARPYFSLFVFAGINILFIVYWQSIHKTGRALTLSLGRSLFFPPILMLLLPRLFGRDIIWFVHSLSEALTALILLLIILNTKRKKHLPTH